MRRHPLLKPPAFAFAFAIGLALVACRSPQPVPGAPAVAAWQKQFKALDCWNPRHNHDMPVAEPLLFAMTGPCNHTPIKRETSGWESLVVIDAHEPRVTAIPITSIYTGGVHFTSEGDVVWYSSGKSGEAAKTQKYVEAYVLRKGAAREQLLGRIELPFVVGAGVGYIKGEGCQFVAFFSFRADDKSPQLRQFFLVNDREPFESAKPLDGIGRVLFWDPLRHHFVVQTQQRRVLGVVKDPPLDRHALDCAGQTGEIDAELGRRLASITDDNAMYSMSRKGDLVVSWQKAASQEPEIVVFHDGRTDRISAAQSFANCPDLACEPDYEFLAAGPWSSSGEYFMIDRGFSRVEVYRASDMQVVKRWVMKGSEDFPAHGFINDHAAYQFNEHSRMTFETW
jgi:hypothetical protein